MLNRKETETGVTWEDFFIAHVLWHWNSETFFLNMQTLEHYYMETGVFKAYSDTRLKKISILVNNKFWFLIAQADNHQQKEKSGGRSLK